MSADTLTRREFLKAGALLGGGALLASSGCSPGGAGRADVETPSKSYGGRMGKRVLVGYATRNGSTVGVAEAIASELGEMGWSADTRPMKDGPGLEGYDAVVLGSAINGGAWLAEAMSFLEDNREELAAVPVAVFCVHAMNTKDTPKAEVRRKAYLDKVRALVDPAAEGYFAGVGPLAEDTSAFARWAFKAFGGDVVGDGRDWDEIRAWARGLAL